MYNQIPTKSGNILIKRKSTKLIPVRKKKKFLNNLDTDHIGSKAL